MVDMTHWTFEGEWGMGDFTDLVWGRIFSQTSLELEIFSLTYNSVRSFFSALYVMSDIFFSAGYLFPRNLCACFFPLEISLQDIFSEIIHNPLKSTQHLVSWQILICQSWNNRGQNSLGERGGIRFHLPLLGESVRWRHNPIFSDG